MSAEMPAEMSAEMPADPAPADPTSQPSAAARALAAFAAHLTLGEVTPMAALFAADAVYEEPPRFAFHGQAAIARFFADFAARHEGISFTILRTLSSADGAHLAAEWQFAYTRTSDSSQHAFDGMCFIEVAHGLIVRWRGFSARMV